MEYHVSKQGNDHNSGTISSPFLTISRAAKIAQAGDTVIVHDGTYREWVKPVHSGVSDRQRITYTAAKDETVIIKGSEIVKGWKNKGNLWIIDVPNELFGDENPFATKLVGDWFLRPLKPHLHTGAVYIGGTALLEQLNKDAVADTDMAYYAEVDEVKTVIYANFSSKNPNEETTEINVRKFCFAPDKSNVNYITVSGFTMCHAATNWAPPTAEQQGMVWARWCKGWIIENNTLFHSRCSAISLGREGDLGHNLTCTDHKKPGFRAQLEIVFRSVLAGWSKENQGSHIVRNNEIFDCGQTGVVGHMGGAFSEIYGNHIHHIAEKEEFMGWEIGGIKLHAAIDTYIHHNCIHHCHRGLWLDWQAQGVRVSSNVFFENNGAEDLYIEVSHGPQLIDNNILNSKVSLGYVSQGNAFVHNWFGGDIRSREDRKRYTPYHLPHSTDMLGTSIIYNADDRFYQNVFCETGTDFYNGCPDSLAEYVGAAKKCYDETASMDIEAYWDLRQPAYIGKNVYTGGAVPYEKEQGHFVTEEKAVLHITEENGVFYAETSLPKATVPCTVISSHELPVPRMTEQLFETATGGNIVFDTDIAGNKRTNTPSPGPLEETGKIPVYKKMI